jgi:hypothetical protein
VVGVRRWRAVRGHGAGARMRMGCLRAALAPQTEGWRRAHLVALERAEPRGVAAAAAQQARRGAAVLCARGGARGAAGRPSGVTAAAGGAPEHPRRPSDAAWGTHRTRGRAARPLRSATPSICGPRGVGGALGGRIVPKRPPEPSEKGVKTPALAPPGLKAAAATPRPLPRVRANPRAGAFAGFTGRDQAISTA